MTPRAYRHAKLVATACIFAAMLPIVAGAQLKAPADLPSVRDREAPDTGMKRYTSSEWGFALDVPTRWNSFPPVSTNSPTEVIRFASNEDGKHLLIIFRNPYDPKEDASLYRDKIQEILSKDGFSNFAHSDAKIGSNVFKVLDADKILNGHLWSVRQFYIVDGTLVHVLGFGTTNRGAMFPLFDKIAETFRYEKMYGDFADSFQPLKVALDHYCSAKHLDLMTPADLNDRIDPFLQSLPVADRERLSNAPEVKQACSQSQVGVSCQNIGYIDAARRLNLLDVFAQSVCKVAITCDPANTTLGAQCHRA